MDLDWITLYDQMTILSHNQIKEKINKFYESFYPLRLKKQGIKELRLEYIERSGLIGIISLYASRVLFSLQLYLQTELVTCKESKIKQQLSLLKIFVEIEQENLKAALKLEKTVYIIEEAYKYYSFISSHQITTSNKGFLEIKILCTLKRLFEGYYSLHELSPMLEPEAYYKIYRLIRLNSIEVFEKAKKHFKLYPQICELLMEILKFFSSDEKESFDFHSHIKEESRKVAKRSFSLKLKKLFSLFSKTQKELFVNLSEERFHEFVSKTGIHISKETIENYLRSEEYINTLVAEEENFLESIKVSETCRGKPEWKKKVVEQMINLSIQSKKKTHSPLLETKSFKMSKDFPIDRS